MGNNFTSKATFILGYKKSDTILMYHTVRNSIDKNLPICYESTPKGECFWVIINPSEEQALELISKYYDQVHICLVYNKRGCPGLNLIDKVKELDFNRISISPCNYRLTTTKLTALYDQRYAYHIRLLGIANLIAFMKGLLDSIAIPKGVMFHAHEGKMAMMVNTKHTRLYRLSSHIKVQDDNGTLILTPKLQWSEDINEPEALKEIPSDREELIRLYLSLDKLTPELMKRHSATFDGGFISIMSDALSLEDLKELYLKYITEQLRITGLQSLVEQELDTYTKLNSD